MGNAYLPLTEKDREEMLAQIGVKNFDELLEGIPAKVRLPKISLGAGISELEFERELARKVKATGSGADYLSFLGGGVYDHFIPATVSALASRGEFLTAYTPYQPEASQGTLQVIFEFQTMIANLTGMDVSTASHYDGATSMAEAALIAVQHTRRKKVIVSKTVHPDYRRVLKTYLQPFGCEVIELTYANSGEFNFLSLAEKISDKVACFIAQSPNYFGVIENYSNVKEKLEEVGALFILGVNPLSLGVLRSPGRWGADIACGEGQPLGIPPSFGGPFVGFMAARQALMRKLPGRMVGETVDLDGERGFVLTLQAREQHIRRQRASSNICTNQGLCMLRACLYMAAVGSQGLRRIGQINLNNAHFLKEKLEANNRYRVIFSGAFFNEFVIQPQQESADALLDRARKAGVLCGISIEKQYPELKNAILVCVTETKDEQDIERLLEILGS